MIDEVADYRREEQSLGANRRRDPLTVQRRNQRIVNNQRMLMSGL